VNVQISLTGEHIIQQSRLSRCNRSAADEGGIVARSLRHIKDVVVGPAADAKWECGEGWRCCRHRCCPSEGAGRGGMDVGCRSGACQAREGDIDLHGVCCVVEVTCAKPVPGEALVGDSAGPLRFASKMKIPALDVKGIIAAVSAAAHTAKGLVFIGYSSGTVPDTA